jgi:hypothetical protein
MANKNHIKVLTTATKVEVNDSDNLITLNPDVSVSLKSLARHIRNSGALL